MKKNLLSAMFLFGTIALQAQTIIYVKPNATGDGTSWTDACDLNVAVGRSVTRNAPTDAQIWIQKGTYYPSGMLTVYDSVKMYGGFVGTETDLSQRDITNNPTIIDAKKKFGSIIRLGISAELNGFTIQNGFAQDNPHKSGGGVFADDNSIIENCIIINNSASHNGGGVYAKGDVKIINSTIKNNTATGNGKNTFGNCLTIVAKQGGTNTIPPSPITISDCDNNILNFGIVSFKSPKTWTISNGTITQEWSDVVIATGCDKTEFNSGSSGNYNSDCRNNPEYGDLFSLCAILRYQKTLCPGNWRVPSFDDFMDLDKVLTGGNGNNRTGDWVGLAKYIDEWGATYGSSCNSSGGLYSQGSRAMYWSLSNSDLNKCYHLHLWSGGSVFPQHECHANHAGCTLRCVR